MCMICSYYEHNISILIIFSCIAMSTRVQLVTDKITKQRARKVFERLGLDLSTGINIYLHRVAEHGGIPFPVELPKPKTGKRS